MPLKVRDAASNVSQPGSAAAAERCGIGERVAIGIGECVEREREAEEVSDRCRFVGDCVGDNRCVVADGGRLHFKRAHVDNTAEGRDASERQTALVAARRIRRRHYCPC